MTEMLPPPAAPALSSSPPSAVLPPPPSTGTPSSALPSLAPKVGASPAAPSVRTQLATAGSLGAGAPRGAVRTYIHHGRVVTVGAGPMRTTAMQGTMMICAYGAVTAWLVNLALHFTQRYHLVDEGRARARLWEHDTILMVVVLGALCVVAMSVTAAWSYAVVRNVEQLGDRRVSATITAASWFVPIAWFQWGFTQLRKAPDADWMVWLWQSLFAAPFAASYVLLRYFGRVESRDLTDFGAPTTQTHVMELHTAMLVAWVFVGCFAAATVVAARVVAGLHGSFRSADQASAAVGA